MQDVELLGTLLEKGAKFSKMTLGFDWIRSDRGGGWGGLGGVVVGACVLGYLFWGGFKGKPKKKHHCLGCGTERFCYPLHFLPYSEWVWCRGV